MPVRAVPQKFKVAFSFAGEQRDLVRSIAEAVEQSLGRSTVFLDQWYEHYIAGPGGDKRLQDIYLKRSELVVVCVSQRYGGKAWTQTEYDSIKARVMEARASVEERDILRMLPIRVGDGDVEGIFFNTIVKEARGKVAEIAELILNRLQLIVGEGSRVSQPATFWPKEPQPFKHQLADRAEREWPAVLQLLTDQTGKRILMFHGPSGYSKSAVLRAAAKYAKGIGIPIAYVDFNDTKLLNEINALRELQSNLGHVLPGFAAVKDPDRWTLRQALRAQKGAILILLDTYEKATQIKELAEWIETYLLVEAEECENLRFIIGGQAIPAIGQARWSEYADSVELERIRDQNVWKNWVHEINPNVKDDHVQAFVEGLEGVPANISTALKTFAQKLKDRP
jgi:TIR domain-containing protein